MTSCVRIGIAASIMGACTRTIRRWGAAGTITCTRTPGGHRRISLAIIEGQQAREARDRLVAGVMASALVLLADPGTRDAARPSRGHRCGACRCQGHVETMQRVWCRRRPGWKKILVHDRGLQKEGRQRFKWITQRADSINIPAATCQGGGRPFSPACLSRLDKP